MPRTLLRTASTMTTDGYPIPTTGYSDGGGLVLAVSGSSARVQVDAEMVSIFNSSSAVLYGRAGGSGVTAGTGNGQFSWFIPPNNGGVLLLSPSETHIAAILASGTGQLIIARRA